MRPIRHGESLGQIRTARAGRRLTASGAALAPVRAAFTRRRAVQVGPIAESPRFLHADFEAADRHQQNIARPRALSCDVGDFKL